MYTGTSVLGTVITAPAAAVATLPVTGFNIVWFVLAAFALFAAGSALLRIVPRPQR